MRRRCCNTANKRTQVTDRIIKLTPVHASVNSTKVMLHSGKIPTEANDGTLTSIYEKKIIRVHKKIGLINRLN